eukprot:364886-Chlamydomonas_euryale.AAC.5
MPVCACVLAGVRECTPVQAPASASTLGDLGDLLAAVRPLQQPSRACSAHARRPTNAAARAAGTRAPANLRGRACPALTPRPCLRALVYAPRASIRLICPRAPIGVMVATCSCSASITFVASVVPPSPVSTTAISTPASAKCLRESRRTGDGRLTAMHHIQGRCMFENRGRAAPYTHKGRRHDAQAGRGDSPPPPPTSHLNASAVTASKWLSTPPPLPSPSWSPRSVASCSRTSASNAAGGSAPSKPLDTCGGSTASRSPMWCRCGEV